MSDVSLDVLNNLKNNDKGIISFEPNGVVTKQAYTWSSDRMDQVSLPLSSTYTPQYMGCGVDVYVLDTGINTNHIEFTTSDARCSLCPRVVSNLWNSFGLVTANTDGDGHGK